MKAMYPALCVGTLFAVLALVAVDAYGCTRVFWNTNPDLKIVGRTEDYVTASHPSFVATPRGVQRWGTADETKRHQSISWTVKYGNVAIYENNRFPNDGMNEVGLTARTLYYLEGDPNEIVAPDSQKKELDEDHWVSFVLDDYDFAEGQPVRLIKRIDLYAQQGWSGNVIPHLVEIDGDIYDQSIE